MPELRREKHIYDRKGRDPGGENYGNHFRFGYRHAVLLCGLL